MKPRLLLPLVLAAIAAACPVLAQPPRAADLFAPKNLVAWCVVPFDAQRRGPIERAQMLQRLGFTRLAYDWRAEHVPTFEQEIRALRDHEIELFAFWDEHPEAFRLFEKYDLHPQIWKTAPSPDRADPQERIAAAAAALAPLVERTRSLGCPLGLYNHGGWGGQPENLVAVCRYLREQQDASHVGIVYNLHHGHEHLDHLAESLALMQPYLLCLNLNGMSPPPAEKILPIGLGTEDARWMRILLESEYAGPIGILDHRAEIDAQKSLQQNIKGMGKLLGGLGAIQEASERE